MANRSKNTYLAAPIQRACALSRRIWSPGSYCPLDPDRRLRRRAPSRRDLHRPGRQLLRPPRPRTNPQTPRRPARTPRPTPSRSTEGPRQPKREDFSRQRASCDHRGTRADWTTDRSHARTRRRDRSRCVSGRDPVRVSDGPASSAAGVSRALAEMPASPTSRSPWTEIRRSAVEGDSGAAMRRRRRGADTVVQETPHSARARDSVELSVAAPREHARDGWLRAVAPAASSLAVVCAASRFGLAGGTRRPVVCVYGRVTRRSPSLDTSLRVMLLDRRRWRRR